MNLQPLVDLVMAVSGVALVARHVPTDSPWLLGFGLFLMLASVRHGG